VICVVPVTRGGLEGKKNQTRAAASSSTAAAVIGQSQRRFGFAACAAASKWLGQSEISRGALKAASYELATENADSGRITDNPEVKRHACHSSGTCTCTSLP